MAKSSIAVMVTSAPHNNFTATAINFVEAALQNKDVDVLGVFFYQDGVLNASKHLAMPNDELQAISHWQRLKTSYNLPLHLCITAGEKRGLSDDIAGQSNINQHFTISGLGELVELTASADRVIQL